MVEACTGIEFSVMTYWYEELLCQLQMCNTSPWNNKWQDIYDFTAHKTAASGVPNFTVNTALDWDWDTMAPMANMHEIVTKVQEINPTVKSVQDIEGSDLDQIRLEFKLDEMVKPELFDVGRYFNRYAQFIIKGVVPSA